MSEPTTAELVGTARRLAGRKDQASPEVFYAVSDALDALASRIEELERELHDAEARVEELERTLAAVVNDYDNRRATYRGRFLLYLLRRFS